MAAENNLSETLFKPSVKHRDTSTLWWPGSISRRAKSILSALDGANPGNWYQLINRLMWIWRGINPWEIEEVLARVAASRAPTPTTGGWIP